MIAFVLPSILVLVYVHNSYFSKYINSVIKYCIKIKNPTILMLIKNAVKKDKIIKFLMPSAFLVYKFSNTLRDKYEQINQNDMKGISFGLN